MILLAIDPGPERSAWVQYNLTTGGIDGAGLQNVPNLSLAYNITQWMGDHVAIEGVQNMGMPAVGSALFNTAFWAGGFAIAAESMGWPVFYPQDVEQRAHTVVYRKDIKLHLCGSLRAKDANVRQALIDRFPATGGGKVPQIGTKKQPGPLYGIKSHLWSALAVAVYWAETHEETT